MTDLPPVPTPEELRTRLDALRAARGYLLPHHGAMAAFAPDLHDAYGQMYRALTLTERHLEPLEKEIVWLAILVAEQGAIGTHHLDLFRRHGGDAALAATIVQLVGYAGVADDFAFVERHWAAEFPGLDPIAAYLDGLQRLCGEALAPGLAHLALAAVQAARGREWGIAVHIEAAYAATMNEDKEDKLAEALSLVIWPTGVNRFVDACTVWHDLMRSGRITPSPRYRAWADMPGQGAFQAPS